MLHKESVSLSLGTLVHSAILEPEAFSKFVLAPAIDKRSKAYKDWVKALPEGTNIVTEDEFDTCRKIKERLAATDLDALVTKDVELSFYTDIEDVQMKCRPDILNVEKRMIIDLKTTRDLKWFHKDALKYQYDESVPHYTSIVAKVTETDPAEWTYVFLAVETDGAFDCDWFTLSDETQQRAQDKWVRSVELYKSCVAFQSFPGYAGSTPKEI